MIPHFESLIDFLNWYRQLGGEPLNLDEAMHVFFELETYENLGV